VTTDQGPETSASAAPERGASVRDHLANERTLLAWQRTALALMGLGFVVDRFAFEGITDGIDGSLVGLALIVIGAGASVAGTWRFLRTERDIDAATYRSGTALHLVLTASIVVGALLLLVLMLGTRG
jgi:putative membrane protein